MPVKIKISYTDEREISAIVPQIKALLPRHKLKKNKGTPPYKHIYFTPLKPSK